MQVRRDPKGAGSTEESWCFLCVCVCVCAHTHADLHTLEPFSTFAFSPAKVMDGIELLIGRGGHGRRKGLTAGGSACMERPALRRAAGRAKSRLQFTVLVVGRGS